MAQEGGEAMKVCLLDTEMQVTADVVLDITIKLLETWRRWRQQVKTH